LEELDIFLKKVKLEAIQEVERFKIPMCSVDAPLLPKKILNLNKTVSLRLHGSKTWYNYLYSEKELERIIEARKEFRRQYKY
jgi:uncharacterized protein YecE (DUF72 family)